MQRNVLVAVGLVFAMLVVAGVVLLNSQVVNGAVLCSPQPCSSYTQILQPMPDVNVRQVEFSAPNGHKLYGVYLKHRKARYTVLINHNETGNMISAFPLAMAMLEGGCSAFIYDYEGFGMSEGPASLTSMMADGDAAFDCVMQQCRVKPSHVITGGSGLGSCVANAMIARNPVSGIITVDAPNRVQDIAKTKASWVVAAAPLIREYDTRSPTTMLKPGLELSTNGANPETLAPQINSFIRRF